MKLPRLVVLTGCLIGTASPEVPDAEALTEVIAQLGAEAFADREAAEQRLNRWADRTPRYLIMQLAHAYGETDDLEVEARLEGLLADLARTWLFYQPSGFLGINFRVLNLEEGEQAVDVLNVLPAEAADAAGLRNGDRILEVDGNAIAELGGQAGFLMYVAALPPGADIDLLVERNRTRFRVGMQLGMRPMEQMDPAETVRREEVLLRDWLHRLRGHGDRDPRFPEGHFRMAD